jgi:23S rRNA U2552 (ribose-2'-O)-methylase RlmE/FtsJ
LAQKKNRIADVGSRLDGYVVHVAASRKISVIDIRPIKKRIPNVEFIKADILDFKGRNKFEIVTSLHTLEHIGLGRYGDPIDPKGHVLCFDALAKLLLPKGQLVVSFPIDSKTRVEFNGQRMIGIREPLEWAGRNNLEFKQFMYLDSKDEFTTMSDESDLVDFVPQRGALGIYFFRKMN